VFSEAQQEFFPFNQFNTLCTATLRINYDSSTTHLCPSSPLLSFGKSQVTDFHLIMTTLKRTATEISATIYPCEALFPELQHKILSFLSNKDILSLKLLSKACKDKYDGP
jgi:hypothetical protein